MFVWMEDCVLLLLFLVFFLETKTDLLKAMLPWCPIAQITGFLVNDSKFLRIGLELSGGFAFD